MFRRCPGQPEQSGPDESRHSRDRRSFGALSDEAGSAVAAAVLVMPLVLFLSLAVTGVIAEAARSVQLRAATIAAAHDASLQLSEQRMAAAAEARVRAQFPGATVATSRAVVAGMLYVKVDVVAPALAVSGLDRWPHITARAHAVVEAQ